MTVLSAGVGSAALLVPESTEKADCEGSFAGELVEVTSGNVVGTFAEGTATGLTVVKIVMVSSMVCGANVGVGGGIDEVVGAIAAVMVV